MSITFTTDASAEAQIERLATKLDCSPGVAVQVALSTLEWALKEQQKGRKVATVRDSEDGTVYVSRVWIEVEAP